MATWGNRLRYDNQIIGFKRHVSNAEVEDRRMPNTAFGHVKRRKPPLSWTAARILFAGSKDQHFLDRAWIGHLLRLCPGKLKRSMALRLIGLSPHYWWYQWSDLYPASMKRRDILEAEYLRNQKSRQKLCDDMLRPHLKAGSRVIDFGCGPGFLANSVSRHVGNVTGVDISAGILTCARVINAAGNISYTRNESNALGSFPDGRTDLVYSFAVFQHLTKVQTGAFVGEFFRILALGGKAIIHTILQGPGRREWNPEGARNWILRRTTIRFTLYTEDEWHAILREAGFASVRVHRISEFSDLEDDIRDEHVVIAEKKLTQ
jgi:ubiquinone/menaquinone biosynthesis C-methylase UbiE